MKKYISFIIVMTIILSLVVPVMAETIITTPISPITGMNELSVRQAISRYFTQRSEYLAGETTIFDTTITPVQADEDKHIEKLEQEGIVWKESYITITSVECGDVFSNAMAEETVIFEVGGSVVTETISHRLRVYLYEGNIPGVALDAYNETTSGFSSCSYIPESSQVLPTATGDGSPLCIINVARAEVGTTEKYDNITDYGDWAWAQGQGWCGAFISWCADQADVATLRRTASLYHLHDDCQTYGQVHTANARGGNYIPKSGDLFFTHGKDDNGNDILSHVGIVVSVTGTVMRTIEGNVSNQVRESSNRTYNDTDLWYFGTPGYASQSHTEIVLDYDDDDHYLLCENCDKMTAASHDISIYSSGNLHWHACDTCDYIGTSEYHSYIYHYGALYHWKKCNVCNYSTDPVLHTYVYGYNNTSHWQKCSDCNYKATTYAHNFIEESLSGAYICTECGYRTYATQIMSIGGTRE